MLYALILASNFLYSQSFTSGVTPTTQCTTWTNFNTFLPLKGYTSMTMYGTLSGTGVTLTDPTTIYNIVLALRTSTAYGPVTFGGRTWGVALCGSGYELISNGAVCSCATGYNVRPCIGNTNWGGINGNTCSASTQTMSVRFSF